MAPSGPTPTDWTCDLGQIPCTSWASVFSSVKREWFVPLLGLLEVLAEAGGPPSWGGRLVTPSLSPPMTPACRPVFTVQPNQPERR